MTEEAKRTVETLRYCEESGARCGECPNGFNDKGVPNCHSMNAIADLIESLSAELEQVKRERDAAVEDLKGDSFCRTCAHYGNGECISNDCHDCINRYNWQWRGVKNDGP